MANKLGTFIFMLFFSFAAFSQKVILNVSMENKVSKPTNDTIYYNINRPITWDDFKGTPDYNNPGGAITDLVQAIAYEVVGRSIPTYLVPRLKNDTGFRSTIRKES